MFKNSVVVTFFYLLSGVLGFGCQLLYARFFGVSVEMDVYFALLSMPSIIIGMVPVVFSSVFIPEFTLISSNDKLNTYIISLSKNVLVLSLLISIVGGGVSIFNLDSILHDSNYEMKKFASELVILLWISAFFSINNGFLSSILIYNNKFIKVATVSLLIYVGILISLFLFRKILGVKSIALGMTIASVLQFIIYVSSVKVLNFKSIWRSSFFIPGRILLFKHVFFVVVSLMPFTLLAPIAYWRALSLPEGSASYLGYSYSFCGFLSVATSMGVAIVSFPDLAKKMGKNGNENNITDSLVQFMKLLKCVIFITVFVSIFMILFRFYILKLFLYRGEFDLNSVRNLSNILPFYLVSAIFVSAMNLIRNLFYSMKIYKVMALLSAIVPILYFILSGIFKYYFSYLGIGLSDTICMSVFFLMSIFTIHNINNKINMYGFLLDISKRVITAAFCGCISYFIFVFLLSDLSLFVSIFISGILYCIFIILVSVVFVHIEEVSLFLIFFKSKIIKCVSIVK